MQRFISQVRSFLIMIGSALLCSAIAVQADRGACRPRCFQWLELTGSWELGAALLCQQPSVSNFNFACGEILTIPAIPGFKVVPYDIKPKFDWGFKIWGGWKSCDSCYFATLVWGHLWSHHSALAKREPQFARFTVADIPNMVGITLVKANVSQRVEYDTVALLGGRNLFCRCKASFYGYGGLRFVSAEIGREIHAPGVNALGNVSDNKVTDRGYFRGAGIEVGVGGEYAIGRGFNLLTRLGAMALLGNRNDTFTLLWRSNDNTSVKFPDRNITKCVPGMDCRVGVNYVYKWCKCGCNLDIVAELGWEVEYYWNILALREASFQGDAITFNADPKPTNFGVNGPYGSLCLRF